MRNVKEASSTYVNSDLQSLCSLENLQIYCIGAFATIFSIVFFLISSPIFIYRWILVTYVVKLLPSEKGIRQPVSPLGNIFATEFMTNHPPRCAIVANFVVENDKPLDHNEIKNLIASRWIDAYDLTENNTKELKYPELCQYIEFWMGFMFWKQDFKFSLDNHLEFHNVPDADDATSKTYLHSLVEDLLNKPFIRKRSPWEIHIIENYRDSELASTRSVTKPMTAIVLRFHHGLADGYSLLYAVIEGLFGQRISDMDLATPQDSQQDQNMIPMMSVPFIMTYILRIIRDTGTLCMKVANMKTTPWHVSDRKKKWKQLHSKSALIPIQKLKEIKNTFGVSFTGTILSCIAAGTRQSLKKKWDFEVDEIVTGSPLPLPAHPKKFINHVTAAVFGLPTSSSLTPLERLFECERRLTEAKLSTLPLAGALYGHFVGSHLASVAGALLYNNIVPTGLSNFPGPGKVIDWNGMKAISADFVAGAVTGVAGVGFMVLSYNGYVRFAISAENSIMEQFEVEDLIRFVVEEVDTLHQLSTKTNNMT